MNLVANYMKNIGKSVAYATIEHIKDKAPALQSFTESNQELYNDTFHAIRDYKTTITKTRQYIQASPIYKAGDAWFNNALEDIKSGNLYNTARDDMGMGDDFGNFEGDFGEDFGEGKSESEPIGAGDQLVVSTIDSASRKNAYAVSNAVASSAKYVADTNKSIANVQFVQNTRMMGVMESGFKGLSNGIDAIHSFNTSAMTTHIENSQRFFTTITQLDQERNAMLKEMRDIMVEQHKAKVEEEKERKYNRFDDIVNANGTPDLKAYMKAIGGNFKSALNEKSGGAMSFMSEENLKMLTNNPLGFIPQFIIGSMMGPGLNTAIQKFDKTIQGAFGTAIARLNKAANNPEASPLTQFLGQVFGLKNSVKSSIDTSKFERGAISFDGETKKSIVEIIPGHLRKIEAALTGMPERMFDMKSGKWTDATKLEKSFKSMKEGFVRNSMSDVSEEMGEMLKSIYFENRKDKEEFIEGMQNAMTKIYEDFGSYNPHDKDSLKHMKYGFKNKTDQKLFDQMFKNLRRGTAMNMANEVMNNRESQNRYMEELEKQGTSVFNNLFNNSGLSDLIKVDEKTGRIKAKLGNVGDAINPLKVEDKFKKNIFDYLRNMENYLFDIRKINAVQSGGGTGRRGGRKSKYPLTDYGHFTEDDWKAHDKARMGTPEKSQKDIDRERRENADKYYYDRAKAEYRQRNKEGKITAKYDRYTDDTSQMTETILMNATSRNIRDNVRALNDNSTWLNDMLKESAKEAKDTLADKDYNQTDKSGKKKDNLFNRLMKAGSLSEKYAVIRDSLGELASKPATILTSVIGKADEQIYDFFYGKETGEKDEHGNPIKGFFHKMTTDMTKTFSRLNNWIDEKILNPINKKFGGKNLWDSAKKGLKGATGIDVDEMWQKGKDFFVGDSGILRPTIDAVKNAYKEAYEEVKRDMKKSYKDANQFLHNDILKEETSEQRATRVRNITGVNNISDDAAFRYAMGAAGDRKRKDAAAKVKMLTSTRDDLLQSITKQSAIVSRLESSKNANPETVAKERAKLEKLRSTLNSLNSRINQASVPQDDTKAIQNFKLNQLKISKLNDKISNYSNDDSELLNARQEKTTTLESAKKNLGISGKLSEIDINAKGNEYLKDKAVRPVFEKARQLEAEVAEMKTELEKLQEEKTGLYGKQKELWNSTGATKESVLSNPEFLASLANANKSKHKGDSKAYNKAMQDLFSIIGYNPNSREGSAPVKGLQDIERSYFDTIKSLRLGDANTSEKVLRTRINVSESQGNKPTALINSLNQVLSSRAEMYGHYRTEFATALGNMGLSTDQISVTIDNLLQQNSPEQLRAINASVQSFIDAARRANPSVGRILSDYEGQDTRVGNYAKQGRYNTFYNQANSNYEAEMSHIWKEHTDAEGNAINPESRTDLARNGIIPFLSQSEKLTQDKEYRKRTGMFADGARMITKAGLAVLSPGEAVVPADENPYNPEMNTADRGAQSRNEKRIKSNFVSKMKGISPSDIGEFANGTTSYGTEEKPGVFAQGFSEIRSGVSDFIGEMFGSVDAKKRINDANQTVRKHLPKGIAGGMVGGTAGLFLGSPLIGAVLGSAASIVTNSETLQESIFGKEIYNSAGEKTGRDDSGLISGKMQKTISKYLPDVKTYGITGGVLGLLTPFGPLGGLMLGSGIAFAKNNESVKNALFGEKDGLINGDTQKMVKKAFPTMAAATLGTMFLGPFGLMGNALLGAGIGMVGSTDEFKDFMLGKPDKDGKRTGGLAGEIREKVVNPLANMASGLQKRFFNFVKDDMLAPIKRSIAPIGKQISLAIKDTFSVVGSVVGKALKSTLGIPLVKRVGEMLKTAMDPFGINAKVAKFGAKWAGKVISAPSKAIGWLGDKAREHQIAKSNADYMTADERLEFMNKRGKDYKLKDYDTMLSNSNKDELERVRDLMGTLKEGRGFLDTRHDDAVKELGKTISDRFDVGDSKKILKAAHAGNMDEVHRMIQESDLSTAEKDELFKKVNKQSENVRAIKYRRDNYTGNENDMFKELKEKYGINGINKDNLDKYRSVLNTEISSRHKPTALKEGEAPAQSTEITSALDANTDKLAEYLKAQTELLAQIRDNAMGINKDQYSSLKATRHLGEAVAEDYSNANHKSAARKNKVIGKMYGKDFKFEDRHENTFQDNDYKYEQVKALGKSSYLFNDLNKVLDFDDNAFKRFVQLAKCGYQIKDYKKIAEVSDAGFDNILKMSEVGFKITNLDQIINADPKTIEDIIELYQNGYGNVGQKDLFNLTGKKSQLLHGKNADAAKVTARFTKNADLDKSGDVIEKTGKNINGPGAMSKWQRAKGFMSSLGNSLMAEYGEPTVLSKGELVVKNGISEHVNGTASMINSNQTTINTDYGPMTYKRSSDGGMELSKDKENTDIADKIKDRDETQKGILENLKIMAGNVKDGAKDKIGKAASTAKGGLLGGLFDLLKLPMTMLKSFGSLLNLPMELLGMGGVLPGLAGKAFGMAKGALGSIASKGMGMLAGTALGKKVGGLMDKFSNTKIGRGFGKIKSALGFGGGAGTDANGNPVDNPTDAAEAVNSSRDTLVTYLQRIIDILGGGKVGGASGLAGELAGGSSGTTTKGGKLARIGGFLKQHAGKIAGASLLAYQAYKGFDGGSDSEEGEVSDTGSSLTDYALDAAQDLVTGLPSGLGEFASGILTKTKDALSNIAGKISKWIPKGAGESVQKFFSGIMDRVKDPKNIEKIAKRAGIKTAMNAAEGAAGIGTLGLGALAIGAGEATMWFMRGWNDTSDNFELQKGASPTMAMKIISGLSEAVAGMTPIGYLMDTKDIVDMATDYLGGALGFSKSDIQKINADAGTESSDNTDKEDKGFFANAWDKTKSFVSNAWDSVKSVGGSVVDGAKSMYNSATNAVSGWWNSHFGNNSGTGKGKYGRGTGTIGSAFHSQLDPANAMPFNTSGDTEAQTMADSGCGPVSATNMAAAMGINIDPKQAAGYALGKGYKEKDGGTKPGFFGDYLGKYGIGTEQVSTSSAMDSLKQGNPVVLMGKDNAGISDKTPYGQYNHYVTATGTDGKGNIIVQDPESNTPDQVYKASDVLSKSSIAIAGKGKFGRGRGIIPTSTFRGKSGRGRWGRGNEDVPGRIWDFLASKGLGSSTIAAIMGNIGHESGGFNLEALSQDGENSYGLCQWTGSRKEKLFELAAQMGKSPADLDVQLAHLWNELTTGGYAGALAHTIAQGDNIEAATDTFCDEFEAPQAGYEHFDRRHEIAQQAFQTQGKGMQTANTYNPGSSSSSSGNKKSGKDYSGLFGQIAQITDALSGAFDLSSSSITSNVKQTPASTLQTANNQQTANPSILMAKLKANQIGVDDYIQQADDNPDTSREEIWNQLESNGFGDDNTKSAYDKYYDSMDKAAKDDKFLQMVEDMKSGKMSIESFIVKADKLPDNIPRNMIKHVFMQNGMWDDNTKAAYDEYYDKKDASKSGSGRGRYGRGKGRLFGRGTDDASASTAATSTDNTTPATPQTTPAATPQTTPAAATPTQSTAVNPAATSSNSGGILGTALSAATSMASKVKSSMGPLASSIGSLATSMFGGNIAKVFGNSNPFTSIFSSGKKNTGSNSGNSGSSGGNFVSSATDAGVKNASTWAEGVINKEQDDVNPPYWYGENGCTAFAQEYLKQEGNPFAGQMSLYAPTLMEQAQSSGMWKSPEQGGSEGDIALLETNNNRGDGPDHAVINDGQGGFWGNSSGGKKIVHSKYSDYFGSDNIWGYISTGAGGANIPPESTGNLEKARSDAGPTSGGGKYGRGKFGRGLMPLFGRGDQPVDPLASIRSKFKEIPSQFANKYKLGEDDTPESAKAKLFAAGRAHDLAEQQKAQQTGTGKYGRGSLDDIRASLGGIDMSNIPSYNIINDDDSLDVAKAKAEKIRQIDAETQQRIMSPQTPTIDSTSVQTTTKESTPVQQPVQQVNVPDNGDKLDKMIDLLTTMNGALLTIASALTGGGNSANTDVAKNVQNTMAKLTKAGGGLSDSLAGQGTNGILSTLLGITSR